MNKKLHKNLNSNENHNHTRGGDTFAQEKRLILQKRIGNNKKHTTTPAKQSSPNYTRHVHNLTLNRGHSVLQLADDKASVRVHG